MSIAAEQLDLIAAELEGAGVNSRQLSIVGGGVVESKLGFSWETVEIAASAFSFSATRSTYTLSSAASSNANVLDNAELLRNGVGGVTRVTTTSATDEWSLDGTTLSIHGDITGNEATYQLRYVVGSSSGPGTASGNMIWLATLPQVPLQTESDYFETGDLDPKWTELDNDTTMAVTLEGPGVKMVQTTHAGEGITGIVQPTPSATQYAITVDLRMAAAIGGTSASVCVFVGEDLVASPSTASLLVLAMQILPTETDLIFTSFTDYDTASTEHLRLEDFGRFFNFLRIWVDEAANTYTALVSDDGHSWTKVSSIAQGATQITGDPATLGIGLNNVNSGEDVTAYSRMFRVDETSDPYLSVGGYVGTSVPTTFLTLRDVTVAPNSILNLYGWNERRAKLIKVEAFSTTVATVGAYTLAMAKDPNGTADNMLSTATFDLTTSGTLFAFVPTDVPLTSTADDLILEVGDVWRVQFVSDNIGLNAAGVYFQLTWLVL